MTAPFSGLYCDTTDNGATGAEQAPLVVVFSTTNDLYVSVDHIVTTWGYADAAMVDLQNDTGLCRAAPPAGLHRAGRRARQPGRHVG